MSAQVPLGTLPGRGVSLPINLNYSSQVWRLGFIKSIFYTSGGSHSVAEAIYSEYATGGWTTSLDVPVVEWPKQNDTYFYTGKPYAKGSNAFTFRVARVFIHMPDASTHELRRADQVYQDPGWVDTSGTYYAVDGSRLRYDGSANPPTLYLPDGDRYEFNGDITRYVDRNGNALSYSASSRQWTDTLGRTIGMPWPANPQATDYTYSVPGVNGATINYTLKFRSLAQALSPGSPARVPVADYYLPDPAQPPGNYNSSNFTQTTQGASLFVSGYSDPEELDFQSYTRVIGRGQSGNEPFNPVVLAEVVLPPQNGQSQSYKFSYNNFGELDKVVYPTGAYQRYQYDVVPALGNPLVPYQQTTRGIESRWLSANGLGTDEVQWLSEFGVDSISVTAPGSTGVPDGVRTVTYFHNFGNPQNNFGYDSALNGLAYEERVYAPASQGGAMIRRTLTDWEVSSASYSRPSQGTGTYTATRNARPKKTVSLFLDTGGAALASASTHDYDLTYQFTVGLDRTSTTEYAYSTVDQTTAQTGLVGQIPLGPPLRTSETTFLTSDVHYRDRNILGLASLSVVKDGAGTIVAQASMSYDESALLTYGSVTGWTNPQSPYRGNLTTARRWLDYPTPTWLSTHVQYDQCGSVRKTWAANDPNLANPALVTYTDAFADGVPRNTYAFPTANTSAIPDATGAYGQTTGLVSATVYDFNTGVVISGTDANGGTTTFEYNDPRNRPTKVNHPDGGWTTTEYSDAPGNIYVRTRTLQQSSPTSQVLESYEYFDVLGRSVRSFVNEGTSYLTADTQYDKLGRVSRVSSPYRTTSLTAPVNPAGKWTTNTYDALSRMTAVTQPDGAQSVTAYAYSLTAGYLGAKITTTDPALKTRQSITDEFGRLRRVIENPGGLGYETNYVYDTLNNLRKVEQGTQLRYFGYDSLSRLIRTRNVEQAVNPGLGWADPVTGYSGGWTTGLSYDPNGNVATRVDARNITTTYSYDALNRNTVVTFSNDPAGTPVVTRTYDGATNGRGKLWKTETGGPSGSRTTLNAFDLMGRAVAQKQQFYSGGAWSASYSVGATYDKAGHVLTLTYPSGHTTNYGYDLAGRTSSFSGNLGEGVSRSYASEFQYNQFGGLQQEKFGTNTPLYHKQRFNERGQLWDLRLSSVPFATDPANGDRGAIVNYYSDNFVAGGSNVRNNGNLLRQEINVPGFGFFQDTFAYDDPLNRLTSVSEKLNGVGNNVFKQSYSYDRFGNRLIDQVNTTANVPHPAYTVDPNGTNRLLAPAGFTHDYDANGNQTRDTFTTASPTAGFRTFDAENRIIAAQKPVSGKVSWAYYTYDGDGKRVRRKIATFEIWQVYGFNGELLAEYPQNGPSLAVAQPQKEYGYRNGQLLITTEPYINSAWGKPAIQTDNLDGTTTAAKAVDGDVEGELSEERTSATNAHANAWWEVDLQSVQSISSITIWGRTDCCPEMTSDFYVLVSDTPFSSSDLNTTLGQAGVSSFFHSGFAGPDEESATTSIEVAGTGRYVRIQLAGNGSLALGEVQVWSAAAKVEWLVADHLGTPRMAVDQTGSLGGVTRHDYLPFGEEIGSPQVALLGGRATTQGYLSEGLRQQYTGYEADVETGLYFAQARYQSSLQGRFTSVDPLGASAEVADPQSFNRYTYVNNSPVNLTDPSGLMGYGAEHSYSDVAEGFWGRSVELNRSHFGGPAILFAAGYIDAIAVEGGIHERNYASRNPVSYKKNWLAVAINNLVLSAAPFSVPGEVTVSAQVTQTILIVVGDPGLNEHNQGRNFERAAETKRAELMAQGYGVIVVRASSVSDLSEALVNNGVLSGVEYIGHARGDMLFIGEQHAPGTNLDRSSVSQLSGANLTSDAYIKINGCFSGAGGWKDSIAGVMANHLRRTVYAFNGPTLFYSSPNAVRGSGGGRPSSTGPLYLLEDRGTRLVAYRP